MQATDAGLVRGPSRKRALLTLGLGCGVFLLGINAIGSVVTLSDGPPANGSWFGLGLTGGQVTFYAWVGVVLFVAAAGYLSLLVGRYAGRAAPPPSRPGQPPGDLPAAGRPTRRKLLTAANGLRATLVGLGAILLVGLVITGAAQQVGVRECCLSSDCNVSTGICPFALTGLWVTVALEAACAGLMAVGIAVSPRRPRSPADAETGGRGIAPVVRGLSGPFLLFQAWGLMALGLLLPWDYFGGGPMYCSEPLCQYPYTLTGYPLGLVIAGGLAVGAGAAILAYRAIQDRRGPDDPIGSGG